MEYFIEINAHHWFVLGLLLLCAEALGAAGFLLGAAVAALSTGVIAWVAGDLGFGAQVGIFALGTGVATTLYLHVFRDAQARATTPSLNQRAASLIGHCFTLETPVEFGAGRVQIGDTFWRVVSAQPLTAGSQVKVVAANDMTLTLEAMS